MCGGAEVQDKPLNVCVLCVYLWVCMRERDCKVFAKAAVSAQPTPSLI